MFGSRRESGYISMRSNSKTIQAAGERVLHRRSAGVIAKPFTTEIPHWSEFDREKNYATGTN
jgi:hypothetical protein